MIGVAMVAALFVAACGRPIYVTGSQQSGIARPSGRLRGSPTTSVVVSIDGLRPDAIAAFKAPTLQRLIDEGSVHALGDNYSSQQDACRHTRRC